MDFDPEKYGPSVARVLALDGSGNRLLPLKFGPCTSIQARDLLNDLAAPVLFPGCGQPDAAMAGLWLYFSCFEEAHELSDRCETKEGSFWHAIVHRLEGDLGNSAYWFRKVGSHPVYAQLA